MAKKVTLREKALAFFESLNYRKVGETRRYWKLQQEDSKVAIFLGKAGAIRASHDGTVSRSHDRAYMYRERIEKWWDENHH